MQYVCVSMSILKYFIFLAAVSSYVESTYHEERLYVNLFTNYSIDVRPVLNDSDSVNVTIGLTLFQILDVDPKNEMLVTSTWTRQNWKNPLLAWNPKDYNGIKSINVVPSRVWKPDIVLYNNIDDDKFFGANLDRLNTRITMYYDGNASWNAPVLFKSKCDIDVTYFPYDTQDCPLKFGSWTYDEDRLDLHVEGSHAKIQHYNNNSEWRLNHALAKRHVKKYDCCKEKYPDITFIISISRRTLYYQVNLVFPMVSIGMLTLCSFILPAESGERMSVALTLMLSMTVFMMLISEMIPTTSDVVPLIGMFFKATMVEMIVMIVVLSFTMILYHKNGDDAPMPHWVRRFIHDWLSYVVRIRQKKRVEKKANGKAGKAEESVQSHLLNNGKENASLKQMKEPNLVLSGSETVLILDKLDAVAEKLRSMDDDDDEIVSEWRIVAMTIDRCLLFIFLFSYLLILTVFYMNSPGYIP